MTAHPRPLSCENPPEGSDTLKGGGPDSGLRSEGSSAATPSGSIASGGSLTLQGSSGADGGSGAGGNGNGADGSAQPMPRMVENLSASQVGKHSMN